MGSYDSYSSGYIDPTDPEAHNIMQMKDAFYQSAYPQNGAFWQQGMIDSRFKVGDQSLNYWMYGESAGGVANRRFFFNLCLRTLNMITGHQRKNRKSTVMVPLKEADQLCDEYNSVLRWVEDRANSQEMHSQNFEGACTTGLYLSHLYLDYSKDPVSGDLMEDSVAFNNFLIDPYWRKPDLSDCNGIWRRRWVSKVEAKLLLPERAAEIQKMVPTGNKDGKFPLQAEMLNLQSSYLFPYDEFYYRDTRPATMIIDPYTGESYEWDPDPEEPKDALDRILRMQPWLIKKEMHVSTTKMSITIGNRVMYKGKNQLGIDEYPFIPYTCYHNPDIQNYAWRYIGIIRNLRDAQFLYNRRRTIELDILESQINSGWIFSTDAVEDPKAFRQSGQGFLVPLKKGHMPNEIQRIAAPDIPASMIELSKALAANIPEISGVSEELLGSAVDDKAALLSMMRQGASLTTLQTIFDKLDLAQRLGGKLKFKAIQKNFTKAKIRDILGHEPSEKFFSHRALKYDVTVEEGAYSTTQRQFELQQKLHFREIGMPISDQDILKSSFISDKASIIENLEQQQAQQQQQMQAQAEMEAAKSRREDMQAYAKARAEIASAQEREARAQEQISMIPQHIQKAELDRTQAEYNVVKSMVEIENLDRDGTVASLDLAMQLNDLLNQGDVNGRLQENGQEWQRSSPQSSMGEEYGSVGML